MTAILPRGARSAVGERLELLCFEREMTFNELSERLEIDRATLYKWRTDKYHIPGAIITLVMVADVFGVSTDWLLGRSEVRELAGQTAAPCPACAERRAALAKMVLTEEQEAAEVKARLERIRTARERKLAAGGLDRLGPRELDAVLPVAGDGRGRPTGEVGHG